MKENTDVDYPLKFLNILRTNKQLSEKEFYITEKRDTGDKKLDGIYHIYYLDAHDGEIFIKKLNNDTEPGHVIEFMNRNKKLGGKGFFWCCKGETEKQLEKARKLYPFELKLELQGHWTKEELELLDNNIYPPFRTIKQINTRKQYNRKRKRKKSSEILDKEDKKRKIEKILQELKENYGINKTPLYVLAQLATCERNLKIDSASNATEEKSNFKELCKISISINYELANKLI
jgi:hypothetical protein